MKLPSIIDEGILDAKTQSSLILDSSKSIDNFDNIFKWIPNNNDQLKMTNSLWDDTGLELWSKNQTLLYGGSKYLCYKLKNPSSNKNEIKMVQNKTKNLPDINDKLKKISELEKDILWIINLESLDKSWPINLMFPLSFPLKYLNNIPFFVDVFHIYKCYIFPLITLLSPLSTIFGPYIYINKSLKLNLKFKDYINFLITGFKHSIKSTGDYKSDSIKYTTMFMYIFFYIYNIIQVFESAIMFHKIKIDLNKKMQSVNLFINIINELKQSDEFKLDIPNGLSGFYEVMNNISIKNKLKSMLEYVYELDVLNTSKLLVQSGKCCYVKFTNKFTKMENMGHIQLHDNQIRNNMSLSKNIIITGPNAAGKTTYIKAIFTNTILSQTLGIACARNARIKIVHAIGSFIRISDNLGSKSLFEAEVERCNELIKYAEEISFENKNAIFFFDEPMHSTPPIEGTATSIAVVEYLSKLPNIKILLTTHYYELTQLENKYPNTFINLSMEAIFDKSTNKFIFPYKIKHSPSYQCIAIELLENNDIPQDIISRAIEIKNKLCINKINDFELK